MLFLELWRFSPEGYISQRLACVIFHIHFLALT
nr:MAG TPA: hypothetical protein [Caudoviricetes sp.]